MVPLEDFVRRIATSIRRRGIARTVLVLTGPILMGLGFGVVGVFGLGGVPQAGAQRDCGSGGCVTVLEAGGLIDSVLADHLIGAVEEAETSPNTRGVLIQLNSEGIVVDEDVLVRLKETIASSTTKVAIWVGPSNATASGGSAELLSWADDTGIANGASIVPERPRLELPSGSTEPGTSQLGDGLEAEAAVKAGLVDRVAPTIGDFLVGLDWIDTKVVSRGGEERLEPVTVARFYSLPLGLETLHTAASPPVAYLALAIGLGLLLFEFFTAGVGVAGAVGALALLLAGYGLGELPIRGWALALVVLSMVAFAVDVQTTIPRFWTGAGLVMFALGSLALFQGVPIPWFTLLIGMIGMAVAMVSGMPSMVRARFGTPTIGRESMIGQMGEVVSAVAPEGVIRIEGALWRARTNRLTPLAGGEPARVVAIDGLLLEVEPEVGGAVDYREFRGKGDTPGTSESPAEL